MQTNHDRITMQTNLPSRTRLISSLTGALFCLLVLLATGGRADDVAPTGPDAVSKQAHSEPDWMPHPDKPRQFSPEELAFIKKCADNEHMEFDTDRNVLIGSRQKGGERSPKKGVVRWSIEYATVLMDSGDEVYRQRALRILEATLPTQQANKEIRHYGNFPKNLEEPIINAATHVDGNQADFVCISLLSILYRHENRLPESMKEQIKQALLLAADYLTNRSIQPTYTNPYAMAAVNLLAIGERYGRPDLVEAGLEKLQSLHELTMDQGSFTEYQAPGYLLVVTQGAIFHILEWVKNPEARAKAIALYNDTWRQVATQYHPPSRQMAGPQLRMSDIPILNEGLSQQIRRAVEGIEGPPPEFIHPSRKAVYLVRENGRVPEPLKHFFNELPEPRQTVQSYWSLTPVSRKYISEDNLKVLSVDTIGTTYLHPDFALGTVNRGHFAPDRRGIMAHWGTPEKAGCMTINFYKNGIPFCAPQHFGVQDEGRALFAATFSTNGGDTHWHFDPIDGSFKAKDLRLSIQFLGIGEKAQINIIDEEKRIAEVTSGKITFRIQIPVATFNGQSVRFEKGKMQDSRTLDIIFHKGDETEFNLKKFKDSAVGIALAVDSGDKKTSFANLKSEIVDHRLNLDWDGLKLSIPTIPGINKDLQATFDASVNGESRKILKKQN